MKLFFESKQLVINSKEKSILFNRNSAGSVEYAILDNLYEPVDGFQLYKDNVLKYSIDIDSMDRVHLVALMKSGELNYSILENGNWSNAIIAKFDLHSKIYSDIILLTEENNINIIYGYANLINSKLWTIQHVIGKNQNWDQYSIAKFISDKNMASYIVDRDSLGNIQLIYSSMEGFTSQVYHTFYNIYANKWNPIPNKLSSSNIKKVLPYIFLDTKDNIHSLWLEDSNNNYILKYSRFSSAGENKFTWNQVKVPYIASCTNHPIIYEEKGILKIIYTKPGSIGYIYSPDYGHTWHEGEDFKTDFSNINLIKISNCTFNSNSKINHVYCSIGKKLNFIFFDSFNSNDTESLKSKDEKDKSIMEEDTSEKTEIMIKELLKNQETINTLILKTIESQQKVEKDIEYILELLMNKKSSLFDKIFK
ncbi:hypothetical protein [Clostridium sp. Cult1]|uniref:hypothetical protein n=1 Tax=Clostridium sp. Cult1 TaxID=2079002 RepID=UPI001F3E65A5|nr:hypothetical protein [Clostridium sp. Cult1]MCF6464135.1 hypothetical protein [Clostridium sp. Cult1]